MMTTLTADTLEADTLETPAQQAQVQGAAPGCGCCIPPPDSVDTRVAQLEERRQRLERKLAVLGA